MELRMKMERMRMMGMEGIRMGIEGIGMGMEDIGMGMGVRMESENDGNGGNRNGGNGN